jgi:5,6-dimethylbenzimidazole synthase
MDGPLFDDSFRARLGDLLAWRRDVRRFRREPLPPDTLERLLSAACQAPSVGLSQPWRFVIVEAPERRTAILDMYRRCNAAALADYSGEDAAGYARLKLAGLEEAPAQVAVFAERGGALGRGLGQQTMPETADYSVVSAIHTLWLVARAEGIGLGWVSIVDPALVTAILDVPQDWRFIAYLCLGYPEQLSDTPELERLRWEHRRAAEEFIYRR